MRNEAAGGLKAEAVVAAVDEHWGAPCTGCTQELVGQEVVLSLFLGYRDAMRCTDCLATPLGKQPGEFLVRAAASVRRLDCYRAGWAHADRRLAGSGAWPEARFPSAVRMDGDDLEPDQEDPDDSDSFAELEPSHREAADRYDAGDMACGELVLKLKFRLEALRPGECLFLTAHDTGAREDLPAWCRLTGHRMVAARHPEYLIERRTD